MLSQELRPFNLDEMAGQDENKEIIKAIIKDPEKAPKCLIFAGAFGSGKTTLARILARELNHVGKDIDITESKFYYEYDSTVIGNVETIRNLRDQFLVSYGDYYRVIVMDECHAISNAAQTALLKVLEEAVGRVFFVLATTDPQKLLPTIRSRSLELDFTTVPREAVIANLDRVTAERNISMSNEVKHLIADRSGGHMRNAHMLIDKYLLLGEEDFVNSIKSAITYYCFFLINAKLNNPEKVKFALNILLNMPMEDLKADWNTVMVESMKGYVGLEVTHKDIATLMQYFNKKEFEIVVKCYFEPWMNQMFKDTPYFQATMLNLFSIISKHFDITSDNQSNTQASAEQQRMDRLRRR